MRRNSRQTCRYVPREVAIPSFRCCHFIGTASGSFCAFSLRVCILFFALLLFARNELEAELRTRSEAESRCYRSSVLSFVVGILGCVIISKTLGGVGSLFSHRFVPTQKAFEAELAAFEETVAQGADTLSREAIRAENKAEDVSISAQDRFPRASSLHPVREELRRWGLFELCRT